MTYPASLATTVAAYWDAADRRDWAGFGALLSKGRRRLLAGALRRA